MYSEAEIAERLGRIESALLSHRTPLPPPMLKVSEVARVLRVSDRTVRRYIDRGELLAARLDLGGQIVFRINQHDLTAFIDGTGSQAKQAASQPSQKESGHNGRSRMLRVPKGLV
jgi:excisionase family DNA binding protein